MTDDEGGGPWEALGELRRQVPLPLRLLGYLALVVLITFVVVLIGAICLDDWALAYNLLVSNTAPDDPTVKSSGVGYLLSLTGWLAAPALVGAWAGELSGSIVEAGKGPTLAESARMHREKHPPPQAKNRGGDSS